MLTKNTTMLHISFKPDLSGLIAPRLPDGVKLKKKWKYSEPNTPRICFSPTILQCFQAVYPNVRDYFEVLNYPNMYFYVYSPAQDRDIGLVTNREIVRNRWVHDAHITGECWATKPVKMVLLGRVGVANTNDVDTVRYHPYGDPKEPERVLGPERVQIIMKAVPGSRQWVQAL